MRAKKVIVLHVRDDIEKEEFMKEVQRLNLSAFIYIHGKLDSLKVNVQGTKEEIREAIRAIRDAHKRVRGRLYPDRKGLYTYYPEDIFREANANISLPILIKTLELLGERVEVKEDYIKSSMPWREIVELVRRLNEVLSQIALQTTRQIREVVAPVSVAYKIDPEELLDLLVDLGIAEYKEDKFKYELVKNKEQALKELLEYLEGDKDEDRSDKEGRESA
ncbi:DUF2067 domain-containing protein [Pyrococcus furiosus DSM 3638]|uniref:DUF2067 domain-containing protein n=3 Tax=Pyrococcus furiosus TaxID=2261 RepID=Q8U4N0_PYRFU|nr:DUF2067 family protein [Pyrococcus furiosus]AAL80175.1 hypothetical protein PF0051 [Pyrococcus furiosus DSM 3638]AFN04522.1 hypothetical protein PFC_07950 [Pyrococcus furiosus COM1]QEK77786.1 DUF2067 domain-containing protein [Pyrococcus furiosus DSM 3638]